MAEFQRQIDTGSPTASEPVTPQNSIIVLRPLTKLAPFHQRKAWQILFQYLGSFLLLTLVGTLSYTSMTSGFFERASYDWFHRMEWFPVDDVDHPKDRFLMIYIDDQSHKSLQQPYDRIWDRNLHADLLEKLAPQQPAIIFLDMLFDQPSSDPEADQRLARAMEEAGMVVLIAGPQNYHSRANQDGIELLELAQIERFSTPIPLFRDAAAEWGNADCPRDTLRRMETAYGNNYIPPAYWQAAKLIAPDRLENEEGYKQPRWLRYPGPPPSIQYVSYSDALQSDPIDFEGKYVFVGVRHSMGMPGAGRDTRASPYGPLKGFGEYHGVELHAILLHNILNGTWLQVSDLRMHLLAACLAALLLTLLINPFGPTGSLISSCLLAATFTVSSVWYIDKSGVFFTWLVPVAIQTPTAFIFANICNYYFLASKRNQLKRVFSSYLSPVMVQKIAGADEEPQLGGHEEEISPFFSDVVGYTKISEVLSPIELTDLMNEYLGEMTEVLQAENGTLDKYIGDAIVAFFGAPLPMQDHAYRACIAATRMQEAQRELRRKWRLSGKWPELVNEMQTRIGINTGLAVVGNMGSPARFNYSMTGDNVNLAARCESGAKHFGAFILVTEDTLSAAIENGADDLCFRKLNRVNVVGRKQPVFLYELMGRNDQIMDRDLECRSAYESALQCYFERDWTGAESHLCHSVKLERWQPHLPGIITNPSLVLLQEIRKFKKHPPSKDWDGVYHLDSK